MTFKPALLLVALLATALPAMAQNLAVVNGKAIPSSRVDALVKQLTSQGQQDTPDLRAKVKQELVNREVLMQEAEKSGLASNPEVKNQLEIARQSLLIRALLFKNIKKNLSLMLKSRLNTIKQKHRLAIRNTTLSIFWLIKKMMQKQSSLN